MMVWLSNPVLAAMHAPALPRHATDAAAAAGGTGSASAGAVKRGAKVAAMPLMAACGGALTAPGAMLWAGMKGRAAAAPEPAPLSLSLLAP